MPSPVFRRMFPSRAGRLALAVVAALAAATAGAEEPGFKALFDGKSMQGWQGDVGGYEVKDGEIRCKAGAGGKLLTKEEFADFDLKFEFRLTPGANNGLGIRAPADGDAAFVGMELQILDDGHAKYATLEPYQYHGSIYGVVAAKRGALKPTGEWNAQEVIAKGSKIKVILNGTTIVDADIAEWRDGKPTIDKRDHPGLKRDRGHIGFLGHGDEVHFRNIRLKAL